MPFSEDRHPSIPDRNGYTVVSEPLDQFGDYWQRPGSLLAWNCLFVLPIWLHSWWASFGESRPPQIIIVKHRGEPIGIAPLVIEKPKARFIGTPDVCDYQDVVVAPGREAEFFGGLFGFLKNMGVSQLDLNPLPIRSPVVTTLQGLKNRLNCSIASTQENVTFELKLPQSWEAYLHQLSGKHRHEIRRKLRRLHEAADVKLRVVGTQTAVAAEMDVFLNLFKANRPDKAAFMTNAMGDFFRRLAENLAHAGLIRLYFLDLDGAPAAAVMCFDYGSTFYLYNNGYDRRFNPLSVGLMSKVLAIRDAIEHRRTGFDFLKGAERYKRRLGGQPTPVYRYRIDLR